jgi:hypothetical protein
MRPYWSLVNGDWGLGKGKRKKFTTELLNS